MRVYFSQSPATHARELVIRTRRNEVLNPRMSDWLEGGSGKPYLCCVTHVVSQRGRTTLRYDVDGYMSLRGYLKRRAINTSLLTSLLVGLTQAITWCVHGGFRYYSLLYNPRYLFVDGNAHPRLVFVPVEESTFRASNSPLEILRLLGDGRRMQVEDPNCASLSERLSDFVRSADGIFSLNHLQAFVKSETGFEIGLDGMVKHAEGSMEDENTRSYTLRDMATGRTYCLLEGSANTVGRGAECAVRLLGRPSISRLHASIWIDGSDMRIVDLGSTNGTYVDGKRIRPNTSVPLALNSTFLLSGESFCVQSA